MHHGTGDGPLPRPWPAPPAAEGGRGGGGADITAGAGPSFLDLEGAREARIELEREAEERHQRLLRDRRASVELLGIASVGGGDLVDEFADPRVGSAINTSAPGGPEDDDIDSQSRGGGGGGGCFGSPAPAPGSYSGDDGRVDVGGGASDAGSRRARGGGKDGGKGGSSKGGEDVEGGGGRKGSFMERIEPSQALTLAFRGIDGFVPVGFARPSPFKRLAGRVVHPREGLRRAERQIMWGLSGDVRPGEVLALMGPSGSGKTTLLSVLGGRPAKALRVTGSLTVNGQPYSKAARRRVGFVLQDDVLYEDLTVLETLTYAALLRLPASMSRAEKAARVEAVIDMLGVRKSRGTIIGGFLRRGISGGERKRVSIGHELLINPAVLMLDEPTSGLDSTSALHLLDLLQDLAADGRAIVSTIHQPSSRLYSKLDRLMLLAEGHLVFSGPAADVVPWLAGFGLEIPFGTSTADFVLDAAMGEAGVTRAGNRGDAAVRELWTAFAAYSANGAAAAGRDANGGANGGSPQLKALAAPEGAAVAGGKGAHGAAGAGKAPREGATYWSQVAVLLGRAIKVRRFEQLTFSHFFQLLFVAAIAGLVWWQRGSTYTRLNGVDVLGLLFFELLFPSFRSLFHALFTFPNEYRMLMKERPAGLYRLSAYYFARTAADVPIEVLNTVLFVIIAYWFGGLNRNAADFFANLGSMVLTVLVAEAWGLLLGGIFMEPRKAQAATTVIMLTFLLVGGYYARNIPVWIAWLRYLSFLFWGFNLTTKIQFRRYPWYDCGTAVPTSSTTGYSSAALASIPECKRIDDIQAALGLPANPHDPAWPDALILVAMLVALRIVIYFTLRTKTRTRRVLMD